MSDKTFYCKTHGKVTAKKAKKHENCMYCRSFVQGRVSAKRPGES